MRPHNGLLHILWKTKMGKVFIGRSVNDKEDESYTPKYAVTPLLKFIDAPPLTIWCPFDKKYSEYVKVFSEKGYKVIHNHIDDGVDFLTCDIPDCDLVISNPPFSIKKKILKRLNQIGKPYAMLLPANMLNDNYHDVLDDNTQMLIFDKRIEYKRISKAGRVPFKSIYICRNFLPKTLVFDYLQIYDDDLVLTDEIIQDLKMSRKNGFGKQTKMEI